MQLLKHGLRLRLEAILQRDNAEKVQFAFQLLSTPLVHFQLQL